MIDYLQIKLSPQNREFVMNTLRQIHVPSEIADDIIILSEGAIP